jgi:hypothetical protein
MRLRSPSALALVAALALACAIAGCGGGATTVGGGAGVKAAPTGGGAKVVSFDPRNGPLGCLGAKGVQAAKDPREPDKLDILPAASGAFVQFASTPAEAQDRQLANQAPGAEVIGPMLLTVGSLSEADLSKVETCLQAQGAKY